MERSPSAGERMLVLGIYVLSGACGLVYEVVWTRHLSLTFGVTVFATSAVLAAFMAGLGLGSSLVARRIDRSPNPVRVYALLEIGIGIYALAVPRILDALTPLYVAAARLLEGHFLLFNLTRGMLAFLVLLVPTTLMGGTVPAIGRYLVARPGWVGWDAGALYGLNTLGAVLGCLGAGFVGIPSVGMSATTAVAAAMNIALGGFLLMARIGDTTQATMPAQGKAPTRLGSGSARLALFVFAASGFSALAYEVVWTRVMVIHVHNTTYAFSVMLAVFLAGLVLGDALAMRLSDRVARPLLWLGGVEVLIGLSVAVAAAAYIPLHHFIAPSSWPGAVALMFARAGVVLLPGALLFGMTFPLAARAVCEDLEVVGRDLGGLYAANTFAGVLGSLAGGFLLVPLVGLRGTLLVLSSLNVALGTACWLAAARREQRPRVVAAALGLALLPIVAIPRTIFFDALQSRLYKLIYYYEGVTDTTGVWESTTDGSRIVTYGDMRGTAGTNTDSLNRVQGHLAHLLHRRPAHSLQIGFGVGNTLAAAALHPEVERLDCVELSPHVRQTAPYFWTNHDILDDPKVRLIVDDGRNYLLRSPGRYQVITLEPPDIFSAGVVNLYTKEFYQLAAGALTDDGLLCQWLPTTEMSETDVQMLVRAFLDVFPETSMWREGMDLPAAPLLLIGTKRPLQVDVALLARRMQAAPVRDDLTRLGIGTPPELFRLFIAGTERTRGWVTGVPPVTDDRTVVDFSTPKLLYNGFGFGWFRIGGAQLEQAHAHLSTVPELYRRLQEPVATLIEATKRDDGAGRDAH